jgi:hypothetical protein
MNKIVSIIFSKNRSLQLDLLLRSLNSCCSDLALADIKVIYKTSDERHAKSYETVQSEWKNIQYIEETNFKNDLVNALTGYDHVLFLVDDTIFCNKFNLDEITKLLDKCSNILGFSLRLGENTDYCFSCNAYQNIPEMHEVTENISKYLWTFAQYDFFYVAEVSSSIYRVKDILGIIEDKEFINPNQLEDRLFFNLGKFVVLKPRMACYNTSVAFANPLNQTTTTNHSNRTGNNDDYSIENLLEIYEKGGRINSDRFYGLITKAAHQLEELF